MRLGASCILSAVFSSTRKCFAKKALVVICQFCFDAGRCETGACSTIISTPRLLPVIFGPEADCSACFVACFFFACNEQSFESKLYFADDIHAAVRFCRLLECLWLVLLVTEAFAPFLWAERVFQWALRYSCAPFLFPLIPKETNDDKDDIKYSLKVLHQFCPYLVDPKRSYQVWSRYHTLRPFEFPFEVTRVWTLFRFEFVAFCSRSGFTLMRHL